MPVKHLDPTLFTGQRWFAGKDRAIARIDDAGAVAGLRLADVRYADGTRERYLLPEPELRWGPLVAALREDAIEGSAGRLELLPAPGLDMLLGDAARAERVPSTDQSNTLVVAGDRLLIKAYRNLRAGVHPEVEVLTALAGRAAPVPAFGGSLRLVGPGGEVTAIALLQEHVAGAVSGWEAPIEAVAAHLRGGAPAPIESYALAGATAARLHAALAAALGVSAQASGARWHAQARAALEAAAALDPLAAGRAAGIEHALAALDVAGPVPLQRIHGDLHVAQLLFAGPRVMAIDFEGDPTAPLEQRRAPDTPLRDLAALLRSIDHVGSAAARRAGGAGPSAWIAAARAAALGAYEREAGASVDRPLLHALEVAAELRELVYAHRQLPEWAYVARAGLRRLIGEEAA